MESEKISFVKYIDKSFNVFQQLWRFRKGDSKQVFNYLFDEHHIPRIKTWLMAGELAVWGLLAFASLFAIFIGVVYGWTISQLFDNMALSAVGVMCLALLGKRLSALIYYVFFPLLLPLWLAQQTRNLTSYWLYLLFGAASCFAFSVVWGKRITKIIWAPDGSRAELTTWTDWINPRYNDWALFFGYPVLLSVLIGMLIIGVLYYKYRPQIDSDKNWIVKGLDSHLLDGDADN